MHVCVHTHVCTHRVATGQVLEVREVNGKLCLERPHAHQISCECAAVYIVKVKVAMNGLNKQKLYYGE